ncbi:MAG: VTT domain-containing protein [Oligoflexia bacterium]|nr:VTT domain-containing protein [Oligoflexia bacterium]
MLDWLKELHSAAGIAQLIQTGGLITLVGIIFAETGLLLGFFLPGDSLLITTGVLSNPLNPNHVVGLDIIYLNIVLIFAAVIGDQVGFLLGRKTGDRIWLKPDGRFYKKKHLVEAHDFYMKYGGISVAAARYVPILRTFVPFIAGVARMPYKSFVYWNIGGGIVWITSLLWIGYYLGQTSLANRLDKIIVIVVLISILPMVVGVLKRQLSKTSK